MKKTFIIAAALVFAILPHSLWAQKEKPEKKKNKETEEIVIRKKGDKEMNLKVEINGDKIIVNGKPLAEFKDDQVTINKRKMTIRDGDDVMAFDFGEDGRSFNMGKDFMKGWKSDGGESRAFLGVTTNQNEGGAKVTEVVKGSAAEKAGLKKDDIITKIDEEKISEEKNLYEIIASKKPKQEVTIFYKRDGKENTVKALLGEKKNSRSYSYSFKGPKGGLRSFNMPDLPNLPNMNFDNEDAPEAMPPGADFDVSPYLDFANSFGRQKKLGLKIQDTEDGIGVKVINVEDSSAAAVAGLKKDDIITEINQKKIENTDDAREELAPDEDKKSYSIKAKRNGAEMIFDVRIPRKLKTANF